MLKVPFFSKEIAPGPRWGLRPQTPAVRRPSARHGTRASLAKIVKNWARRKF